LQFCSSLGQSSNVSDDSNWKFAKQCVADKKDGQSAITASGSYFKSTDAVPTMVTPMAQASWLVAAVDLPTVPTLAIETALGVINLKGIVQASPRVKSCVLGAEDLAADLVAVRTPQADELAYARSRFLLECRALGIEPIDPPYTYSDADGCERESRRSRQLGYRSKSAVTAAHINIIHRVFTPSPEEIDHAGRLVAAFESVRAKGQDRALVDGLWIEPPAYLNAQRVLERARRLDAINRAPTE
jgi:citrate lyase beta subunit